MEYTKDDAIDASKKFIEEVRAIEEKYDISFNSDTGDIYLSYKKCNPVGNIWDSIKIGWIGDGSGLTVISEKIDKKKEALAKLTEEDKEILGLTDLDD